MANSIGASTERIAQNHELDLARLFIEQTDTNVFLTGRAGTGKTTFLRRLREDSPKRMVVVAPTGVAAINAGGVTIHSFFQLPLSPYVPGMQFSESGRKQYTFSKEKKNILRSLDLLVIDEISMVRADLLDAIDSVLRRYKDHSRPFGGVQLLMIGDLQQLSPVVKDNEIQLLKPHYDTFYFFGSHALRQSNYVTIELKTIYRQTDENFVRILNAIRERRIDANLLNRLNERYLPNFPADKSDGYIRLTTHNHTAQAYNEQRLNELPTKAYAFQAKVEGNFNESLFPADATLLLKQGAQVMFIRNDETGQGRYYNGKIGYVESLSQREIVVQCDDEAFAVEPSEWANSRYILDEETKEIREEIEGTFRQYPLRLAWAITIHKSQGLTFEKAVIDAASSFAHGQVYVALSRCKSLEGLVLASPVTASSIINDSTVSDFMHNGEALTNEATQQLSRLQHDYFCKLLDELFDFRTLRRDFDQVKRLLDEFFYKLYPTLVEQYAEKARLFAEQLTDVSTKFRQQYMALVQQSDDCAENTFLQARIAKAATYFHATLNSLLLDLLTITKVDSDNQTVRKRMDEALFNLNDSFNLKCELMRHFASSPFSVKAYLHVKALITLNEATPTKTKEKKKKEKETALLADKISTDILYPQLYEELREWRRQKSNELSLPAYTVLQQKALICMANSLPDTMKALIDIPYFGKRTAEKYGEEILAIIKRFAENK
jgi:GTPase SAR1 family protein